jgi:hypothetical protein
MASQSLTLSSWSIWGRVGVSLNLFDLSRQDRCRRIRQFRDKIIVFNPTQEHPAYAWLFWLYNLFLLGPCSVFYPANLFFCDVDVQLLHQVLEVIQVIWGCLVFHLLRFFLSRLSWLHDLFMLISWFWLILWHLRSRRCCGCLRCGFYPAKCHQWCTLRSSFSLILVWWRLFPFLFQT